MTSRLTLFYITATQKCRIPPRGTAIKVCDRVKLQNNSTYRKVTADSQEHLYKLVYMQAGSVPSLTAKVFCFQFLGILGCLKLLCGIVELLGCYHWVQVILLLQCTALPMSTMMESSIISRDKVLPSLISGRYRSYVNSLCGRREGLELTLVQHTRDNIGKEQSLYGVDTCTCTSMGTLRLATIAALARGGV